MARRWYPKGTDYSKCSKAEVPRLQDTINSINRFLLGGLLTCTSPQSSEKPMRKPRA